MEYELIICLIPAVVPFKFCICAMAIELAQCMKRPRLKIPFSPGFTQVFFWSRETQVDAATSERAFIVQLLNCCSRQRACGHKRVPSGGPAGTCGSGLVGL